MVFKKSDLQYIFITSILIVIVLFINNTNFSKELFTNEKNYSKYKLNIKTKPNLYIDVLSQMHDRYRQNTKVCGTTRALTKEKLLFNDIFDNIDEKNIDNSSLSDKKTKQIYKENMHSCNRKSSTICEFTDPMLYLSQRTFQPKWTFKPYKDIQLPKNTDLKCWTSMYNCCKN